MTTTVQTESCGTLPDGREAKLFRLDGGEGVTAAITNFGGVITSLRSPDRAGNQGEIGLGRPTLKDYVEQRGFYGALVGRVGNRIAKGRFTLDGTEYRIWTNQTGNAIHGGKDGFNRKLWDAAPTNDGVRLAYLSPDGEEGFPGNLRVTVTYALRGKDLSIDYHATTDAPTIINMTHHEYFNLNCRADTVLAHTLRLRADRYTPTDAAQIPTGEIAPVAGTPFDFTTEKVIARDMEQVPNGYDHNFVFADDRQPGEWLAEVFEPTTGRTLHMSTTEPCVQLYVGGNITGKDMGADGKPILRFTGLCLEAQKHPDAVNHPNFANTVLRPGEEYRQTTIYRFGTK